MARPWRDRGKPQQWRRSMAARLTINFETASYALTAAADFVLSVFADVETNGAVSARRIALTKLRDGPTGWSCEFELCPFKIGLDEEGMDIVSAFVDPKPNTSGFVKSGRTQQKKKPIPESMIAFNKALEEAQQESGIDRNVPGKGTVRVVQVADVRSSFARHYRPKGGGNKGADAQRQAFNKGDEGRSGRRNGEARVLGWGGLALAE
jgi:hypothetical protein